MLQGVTSFHELATPIMGRLKSSSFNPIARNIERCGARSGPSVTAQLRCLSLRSAIFVKSPSLKTHQHNTAKRQKFPDPGALPFSEYRLGPYVKPTGDV